MEKYLLQILESNNRVIVPEFGAFIIKQKNPLTIIFNEFLQYNDGMLVDAISKNEGIDRDSAKKKIDEFIVKMNSELESKGNFTLPGIGIVTKGTSGKISLEKEGSQAAGEKVSKPAGTPEKKPAQSKAAKKPAVPKEIKESKEETIEIVNEKPVKEEPKKEEKPKVEEKVKTEEKPKVAQETPKPEKELSKEEKPKVAQEAQKPKIELPKEEKTKVTTEPVSQVKKPIEEKFTSFEKPAYSEKQKTDNNNNRTRLIIWLVIIVIVNGALIGYFFYSEEISSLFTKKSTEVIEIETYPEDQLQPEVTESPEGTIEEMTPQKVEEEKPVQKTENFRTPVQSGSRFYVVAGVFGDENNANNLVTELRNKGYNAEKFGKIGKLHAVSYNVYSTKAEADREMRRIQNEVDPEAWIKEVK